MTNSHLANAKQDKHPGAAHAKIQTRSKQPTKLPINQTRPPLTKKHTPGDEQESQGQHTHEISDERLQSNQTVPGSNVQAHDTHYPQNKLSMTFYTLNKVAHTR